MVTTDNKTFGIHRAADFQLRRDGKSNSTVVAGGSHRRHLQAQTNSLTTGLGTNWVTVTGSSGTNQLFLPISPSSPSVFFRLSYP